MSEDGRPLLLERNGERRPCRWLFHRFGPRYQSQDEHQRMSREYDTRTKAQKVEAANAIWDWLDAGEAINIPDAETNRRLNALDGAFTKDEIISVEHLLQLHRQMATHKIRLQRCYDAATELASVFVRQGKSDDCLSRAEESKQALTMHICHIDKKLDAYEKAISALASKEH